MSHSPNPWPQGGLSSFRKLIARVKKVRTKQEQNEGISKSYEDIIARVTNDSMVDQVRRIIAEMSSSDREQISSELTVGCIVHIKI